MANSLMETAADILNKSKSSASSAPSQKLPGEEQDLGGPTPQNGKPTDDSEKIDTTKGTKAVPVPKTHPSDASSQMPSDNLKKEDTDDVSNDVNNIFEGEQVSEDFIQKASVIFEARVSDRVKTITESIEEKYKGMLEEAINKIQEELASKVDDYLGYVVEQYMEENSLAIDSGLRTELAEDFIGGLKTLFSEHYIDIPEDKVKIVDELSEKVVVLQDKLNESIEDTIKVRKELTEAKRTNIIYDLCEGLIDTQAAKIKSLAESVEFISEEDFRSKIELIKENYFPTEVKKQSHEDLHESVEDTHKETVIHDDIVAATIKAINNLNKN